MLGGGSSLEPGEALGREARDVSGLAAVQVPQELSAGWRPFADPQLPAVFTGGWVGYCGYDTVRYGYLGAALAAHVWRTSAKPALMRERLDRPGCWTSQATVWRMQRGTQHSCEPAQFSLPESIVEQGILPPPAGKLPFDAAPADDRGLPDMHLALYNDVVVFDHATKLAYVISWVHIDEHPDVDTAYQVLHAVPAPYRWWSDGPSHERSSIS